MAWLAGVDGCRLGWFRACREMRSGEIHFGVVETARQLISAPPQPELVAIDIPIGLPPAGARECDQAARKLLGPRRNSVFPAPIRAAMIAQSREEASAITTRADGRKVATQAWAIFRKIREVDEMLQAGHCARVAIREVHPEVSFCAWNGGQAMEWAKKTREGVRERVALVEDWLGKGVLDRARVGLLKKDVADDDILDAIAALWSAHRIANGGAETLPAKPARDAVGLPMEIVY